MQPASQAAKSRAPGSSVSDAGSHEPWATDSEPPQRLAAASASQHSHSQATQGRTDKAAARALVRAEKASQKDEKKVQKQAEKDAKRVARDAKQADKEVAQAASKHAKAAESRARGSKACDEITVLVDTTLAATKAGRIVMDAIEGGDKKLQVAVEASTLQGLGTVTWRRRAPNDDVRAPISVCTMLPIGQLGVMVNQGQPYLPNKGLNSLAQAGQSIQSPNS
jgi:hypothetical protein